MRSLQSRAVLNASNKLLTSYCRPVSTVISSRFQNDTESLKSWKKIPGPWSLPFIGQLHHFLPGVGALDGLEFYDLADNLYKNYGPIVRLDGILTKPPQIFLYDPEAIAQVLRGENWLPVRPGLESLHYHRKYCSKLRGDCNRPTGLVSEHGETWKSFRTKVNPVMMQIEGIKQYKPALDAVALDMVQRIRHLRNEKNVITETFDREMNKWALESICTVAVGQRIGCLDDTLAEDSPAWKLIQTVHEMFQLSADLDIKPSLWQYYPTMKFKRAMTLYEEQLNLANVFIQRAIEALQKEKPSNTKAEKSVLQKLLEIDEYVALVMASDMLIAGVDTAANTVISTLYFLATNPEKQNKLREEILSTGMSRPYLQACIKEALRMSPVVPGNIRQTTKEYNLLGYRIPKGMSIFFPHQHLSMQEKHFPLPTEYVPERFLVGKSHPLYYGNAHAFAMLPFGFGNRMCIGRRIAELEMRIFISRLVENFHVEWEGPTLKKNSTTLNYAVPPFNFVFKDI